MKKQKETKFCTLTTPYEAEMRKADIPFAEYPRPMLQRDSYICLNGLWDFEIDSQRDVDHPDKILVPFPPESRLSGVEVITQPEDVLIYRRTFTLPQGFRGGRWLLHFGAVDQVATVKLNSRELGVHEGGYLPFSFDITEAMCEGENALEVIVTDTLDHNLPWGKQRYDRGGMWYTPVSGIWQTVWLECVPDDAVENLRVEPSLDTLRLDVFGGTAEKTIVIRTPDGELTHSFVGSHIELPIPNPRNWSPDDPYLYHYTLTAGEDCVSSYFALRTVSIEERSGTPVICLNGKPTFFHGLLDQGYFSDGIFLPATEQGFRDDILRMKALGFNMLRKHIKLEPELFYYYCDLYGMVVFQDFINSGDYSFFYDTALPTACIRRGLTHRASRRRREIFYSTGEAMVAQLYSHPCVCYYTIFNEGWGQFDADNVYDHFRALDPSRVWDATSGWFKHKRSDVESDHIYFKPVKLKSVKGRPMVLSEFGGYSLKLPEHSFNLDQTYGYRKYTDPAAFEQDLIALYRDEIIPAIDQGLCATVYTQVSDVEDETNGLLTYDRAVCKVDKERMCEMAQSLHAAFTHKHATERS